MVESFGNVCAKNDSVENANLHDVPGKCFPTSCIAIGDGRRLTIRLTYPSNSIRFDESNLDEDTPCSFMALNWIFNSWYSKSPVFNGFDVVDDGTGAEGGVVVDVFGGVSLLSFSSEKDDFKNIDVATFVLSWSWITGMLLLLLLLLLLSLFLTRLLLLLLSRCEDDCFGRRLLGTTNAVTKTGTVFVVVLLLVVVDCEVVANTNRRHHNHITKTIFFFKYEYLRPIIFRKSCVLLFRVVSWCFRSSCRWEVNVSPKKYRWKWDCVDCRATIRVKFMFTVTKMDNSSW